MTIEIVRYRNALQADVIALWEDCGLDVPWNDPVKDIERKCLHSPDMFLVALEHAQLVGTIMGGYDGHRGWINYLAVHADWRHRSLGRRLVSEIESRLLALGCPKINLQIRESNAGAAAFYEKIGYNPSATISYGKRLIPDD